MNAVAISQAMVNFAPNKLEEFHTTSVKFFTEREPHALSVLRKIQCPVELVHCGGDIAYPLECVEELQKRLVDADVDAHITQIEGAPHFGIVTHPKE